jgi:hypothetical protein
MLALHPRLGICRVLALYLHQTKNKARWRSSVRPQIQVRTLNRFSGKPGSILASCRYHSGLGGSDVSFETEVSFFSCQRGQRADLEQSPDSPPNGEENLVRGKPSKAIYKRHMYLKGHGFPLWIPQPNMRLSHSYRRQGVSIGDVGIFTSNGGFDFLFNVCLPAGHPNNPNELPEGFSCLVLRPTDVSEFHAHPRHSHLASPSVKKRG